MSMAKPRPQAGPKKKTEAAGATKRKSGVVVEKLDRKHFDTLGASLAVSMGFDGQPDWFLNEIQVCDAQAFCAKSLHEAHQASLNEDMVAPSAEAVCDHLGIKEPEERKRCIELVRLALKAAAVPPAAPAE